MTLEEICSRAESFIAAPVSSKFDEVAREIFRFQFEQNAPYRRFCESQGINPVSLDSLEEIPSLLTSAFKDLALTVLPPGSESTVFHSSGTTLQRPSRHYHSERTLRVYEQSLLSWFRPNVLPDASRANFLMLSPRRIEAPHSSLVHMLETIAREHADSHAEFCASVAADGAWSLNFEQIMDTVQKLHSTNVPAILCGTAFSFVHLLDFLKDRKLPLSFPEGSRVFETGGYKGRSRSIPKADLHAMISAHLKVPRTHIISEYGMSELSSQAYDRKPGDSRSGIYQFPPWTRPYVMAPETGRIVSEGETGLLRLLDLANVGSVMMIQTEDLARRRGNGFELLGRAALSEPRGCSLMNTVS